MIKAGSIYSRRPSVRRLSNPHLNLQGKSFQNGNYLKSTSDEVDTRRESTSPWRICMDQKENQRNQLIQNHQQGHSGMESNELQSFFDSLTQYQKKPTSNPQASVKAISSLQQIFLELKSLQRLEKNRAHKQTLSDIQNKLLSLERTLLNF